MKEILSATPQPQAVDVWIMGKAFERIVGKWSKRPKTIDEKVEEKLKTVIGKMITAP